MNTSIFPAINTGPIIPHQHTLPQSDYLSQKQLFGPGIQLYISKLPFNPPCGASITPDPILQVQGVLLTYLMLTAKWEPDPGLNCRHPWLLTLTPSWLGPYPPLPLTEQQRGGFYLLFYFCGSPSLPLHPPTSICAAVFAPIFFTHSLSLFPAGNNWHLNHFPGSHSTLLSLREAIPSQAGHWSFRA